MCYLEIMNAYVKGTQAAFFFRERQSFKEEITNHYWKKYWVIAILKTVHKLKGIEPSIHPFFSIQRLQYVDEMSYKLDRGLKEIKFSDIYDQWVKILRERGVYHPIWNHEDMDLSKPCFLEITEAKCYWRKFCHSERTNWHFTTKLWDSRIKMSTSFLIG